MVMNDEMVQSPFKFVPFHDFNLGQFVIAFCLVFAIINRDKKWEIKLA